MFIEIDQNNVIQCMHEEQDETSYIAITAKQFESIVTYLKQDDSSLESCQFIKNEVVFNQAIELERTKTKELHAVLEDCKQSLRETFVGNLSKVKSDVLDGVFQADDLSILRLDMALRFMERKKITSIVITDASNIEFEVNQSQLTELVNELSLNWQEAISLKRKAQKELEHIKEKGDSSLIEKMIFQATQKRQA